MKFIFFSFCILFTGSVAIAQFWTPVSLSGFNVDLIANGGVCGGMPVTVAATTTSDFDGFGGSGNGYTFYARNFVDTVNDTGNCIIYNTNAPFAPTGLPPAGLIVSRLRPDIFFQLASYDSANVMLMRAGQYDSISFSPPARFDSIAFLAAVTNSYQDTVPIRMIVQYQNTPNDTLGFWIVSDWLKTNAPDKAAGGFGRVLRGGPSANQFSSLGSEECNLYQKIYAVNDTGYIKSIILFGAFVDPLVPDTLVSPGARFGLFAISGLSNPPSLNVGVYDFSGSTKNGYNQLTWKTEQEEDIRLFEIEHSEDGNNFQYDGSVEPKYDGHNSTYQYIDMKHSAFPSFYRLKTIMKNGDNYYSNIVKLSGLLPKNMSFSTYPVPFNNEINVRYENIETITVTATLYHMTGLVLKQQQYILSSGTGVFTLGELSSLPKGIYIMKIQNSYGNIATLKLTK